MNAPQISDGSFRPLLEDLERERTQLLLHIAVTSPHDAEELSRRIARPTSAIHDDLKSLMASGAVHVFNGTLRTSAATRIVDATPTQDLRDLHDQVLAELASGYSATSSALVALVESGCTDEPLLLCLIEYAGAYPDDAAVLGALTHVARARGVTSNEVQLLHARNAALQGTPEQVLSFTDPLFGAVEPAIVRSALVLAACAHIQGNRLQRSEALFRHAEQYQLGRDAAWGVVASLGQGHLAQAQAWHEEFGASSFTSHATGLHEMTEALMLSVQGDGTGALDVLARSIATLNPLGKDEYLPETPAALAAIIAIGQGEPQTAQVFLERAIKARMGGRAGLHRHGILLAWALMAQGYLEEADRILVDQVSVDSLGARDLLLYWCLQAGLARRRADTGEMRLAWQEIRGLTFGMHITLYDLLPLGEMMVVAARLRDSGRIQDLTHQALSLLNDLGNPITWSAPLHWCGVQAAFQAEDPAALLPHANALVRAGSISPYAATLAQAGSTWLDMLRGETDFESIEASARALATRGHVWDAARMTGQAALQHPEREQALSMMQLAREIDKDHARHVKSLPQSSPLTSRELEVGRLVLDGHGYRVIGERLFISPKTVEHHVARIRSRLGALSRGDLMEKLHDELARLSS